MWLACLQFHAVVLATFASIIAPFGGFFASGFKRGFKIKDFGDSIPGHGGMTDRMDCQVLSHLNNNCIITRLVCFKLRGCMFKQQCNRCCVSFVWFTLEPGCSAKLGMILPCHTIVHEKCCDSARLDRECQSCLPLYVCSSSPNHSECGPARLPATQAIGLLEPASICNYNVHILMQAILLQVQVHQHAFLQQTLR